MDKYNEFGLYDEIINKNDKDTLQGELIFKDIAEITEDELDYKCHEIFNKTLKTLSIDEKKEYIKKNLKTNEIIKLSGIKNEKI